MTVTLGPALVSDLAAQVSGPVLGADDAGYDAARAVHNGLIDRRPAVIVRCRKASDVVATLACARRGGLEISVRGGGHNVAGRAVTHGGVMIDLAEMKGIRVDPDSGTVRAEAGVTWGELNDAAAEHALAVTGGAISSTGIAGYTLGGGLGWLMAKHGLAADNLLESSSSPQTGTCSTSEPTRIPICSGRFEAVAGTLASRRRSHIACTRCRR